MGLQTQQKSARKEASHTVGDLRGTVARTEGGTQANNGTHSVSAPAEGHFADVKCNTSHGIRFLKFNSVHFYSTVQFNS